jgi:hypothetical protein
VRTVAPLIQTPTGRAFFRYEDLDRPSACESSLVHVQDIADIEAEAAALERKRLRQAVHGLGHPHFGDVLSEDWYRQLVALFDD